MGAEIKDTRHVGDYWDDKRKKEGNYFTNKAKAKKKLAQIRKILKNEN